MVENVQLSSKIYVAYFKLRTLAESRAISRLGLFMKGNAWETASLPAKGALLIGGFLELRACNYFYTIDRRVGELARFRTYL